MSTGVTTEGGFIDDIVHAYVTTLDTKVETSDKFSNYAPGHARRVAEVAVSLAEAMMLDDEQVRIIKTGALLHDIGEVILNQKFYHDPQEFSAAQMVDMWQHSLVGEREVARRGFGREEQLIVRWHHEWYNGNGYPDMLFGADIPVSVRIVRLADSWDAITHKRTWRRAYTKDESVQEVLIHAGSEFDPEIVLVFLDLLEDGTIQYHQD
ncbi:MAG: HD domain-containing phosphohydrolase [Deinococcota bacterium]